MAFQGFGQKQGFGKDSGPVAAPKAQVFGHSPQPPSPTPPFSTSPLQQSTREVEAPAPKATSYFPRLASQVNPSLIGPAYPSAPATRPATSSPIWGNQVRFPGNISNSWTRDDYSGASPGSVQPFTAKHADAPVPTRTRSPPLQSASAVSPEKSSQTYPGSPAISPTMWGNQVRLPGNFSNSWSREDVSAVSLSDPGKPFATMHVDTRVPVRNRSPPLQLQNGASREKSSPTDFGRPSLSPLILRNRSDNISTTPDSVIPYTSLGSAQSNDNKAAVTKATNYPVSKRNRSVELSSTDEVFQRHSAAQTGARSIDDRLGAAKPTYLPVSKRTRSPPLPANQVFNGNSLPPDDDERELQAKAKRLARFKVELSQPEQSTTGNGNPSSSVNKRAQSPTDRSKIIREHSSEMEEDSSNAGVPSDYEGPESCTVIIGVCPDMCPQSEREERERKGDLDQFERLDGDRNRTTKSLAVKKYTRTAEREAELIRPMPILQKTIAYLLYLLDQPYDEKFLGLYNFLWDRMRAIRMDLRMQHLFNLNAIAMLEQMIRLHIIAMHELCEHTKGEGFSEGFDAHLNIEQMNKTSVELFQLYDDHRKKGINVPTEKEFRGYYALLKLDKHPGYKVEPAELSHDLSKMTSEIRQTSEVLFARDVARACRTGNFIAFFRLARKASYLQACLMHAHFAKLRTQALASLHCGLQNNQGIPVTLVAKWLAMEEDDIENLLEYHGFVIKEFEEPYMVKEGPFLNNENDYPLKCSKLVHLKRSQMIVEDVSSPPPTALLPSEEAKTEPRMKVKKQDIRPVLSVEIKSSAHVADAVMAEYRRSPSPKDDTKAKPSIKGLPVVDHSGGGGNQMAAFSQLSRGFSFGHNLPKFPQASVQSFETPNYNTLSPSSFKKPNDDTRVLASLDSDTHANEKTITWQAVSAVADQDNFSILERNSSMKASAPQDVPIQDVEDEVQADSQNQIDETESSFYDEEAYEAKLRLFLRIWRRRSVKKRELREQRQLVAVAALSSLSLGPPVRQKVERPSTPGGFNIDHIMNERYQRHERSWSRLNVSDVIASIVSGSNTAAKYICWKMILCSGMDIQGSDTQQQSQSTAWPWLLSKLIPSENYEEDDLVVPSPSISIWRKWGASQTNSDFTCFLSVVRKAELQNARDEVSGANAVLFFVSESIPLEVQKFQLHSLVMSLPSGSRLPLLILIDSSEENMDPSSVMAEKLGLIDLDRSRVSNSSIVFLVENKVMTDFDGFFSDEKLRGGLQWLASQSASQPVVSCVKTHELVSTHLSSSLQVLDAKSVYEVGPDHCISAFNEVLYEAAEKVSAAAAANPSSWPCPETALLDKSMKSHFPDIGWSSSAKLEPAISALRSCELAAFKDDVSWLFEGCNSGSDIENQRIRLTNCLIKYLSERSRIMGSSLAIEEAHVMLQQNVRLELHDSTYYIIPNWINIFRRIFNWRLMSLSDGTFSTVYVLEQDIPKIPPSPGFDTSLSPYHMTYPSLDEMVQVSFGSLLEHEGASQPQVITALDCSEAAQEATDTSNRIERTFTSVEDINVARMNNGNYVTTDRLNVTRSELVPALEASREADRLNKLLEQCNILQDTLDKKLSIYF